MIYEVLNCKTGKVILYELTAREHKQAMIALKSGQKMIWDSVPAKAPKDAA